MSLPSLFLTFRAAIGNLPTSSTTLRVWSVANNTIHLDEDSLLLLFRRHYTFVLLDNGLPPNLRFTSSASTDRHNLDNNHRLGKMEIVDGRLESILGRGTTAGAGRRDLGHAFLMMLSIHNGENINEGYIELLACLLVGTRLAKKLRNGMLVLDIAGFAVILNVKTEGGIFSDVGHGVYFGVFIETRNEGG